ncbi:endonuclease domain-containing 1 protein-like [Narcine bancroftii]|uniref:endonuclease domain-containing 1 protein-like n=1 Tax=Narcine bancroftii TaxID=1343680 RepID=UPI00383175B6
MGPLLLLCLSALSAARGKVVRDFQECGGFFQDGEPPQGFDPPQGFSSRSRRLVRICQRYKNQYHFATLYRTELRIPVYSAYRYPCSLGESSAYRPNPWFHEPQLDNQNAKNEMQSSSMAHSLKQATDEDYRDSGYDRGHLYPFSLNDKESATATCTLTNAVPEKHGANVNWYQEAESVVEKLAQICHKSGRTMYLLTGSANPSRTKIKNRVSVPGTVWTALCCTSLPRQSDDPCLSGQVPSEGQDVLVYNRDFSFAFIKEMVRDRPTKRVTVRELQKKLRVSTLFHNCRGMTASDEDQTFKEVEGLIENKIINPINSTGSSLVRPFGYEATSVILQSACSLTPAIHTASCYLLEIAKVITPIVHGVATVVGIVTINTCGVLINNRWSSLTLHRQAH